jgi:hypothetical protein
MSIIFKTKKVSPPQQKKYRIIILLNHLAMASCPAFQTTKSHLKNITLSLTVSL